MRYRAATCGDGATAANVVFCIQRMENEDMTNRFQDSGEIIDTTAGQVASELSRRGISADDRVTIMVEPEAELIPGRREARARVIAAGLSDDDIDQLIKEARREANEEMRREAALTPH